ncbi:hypothetical protein CAPTEDRAFT_214154, partial [Capitella teleta]
MNDYSADGDLLPCAFVHIERRCTDMDITFSCSCRSALLLQTCAQNSATMVEEVVPEGIMCMHCRFLKDNFSAMIEVLHDRHQVDSHLKRCVRRSQKLLQQGVVPLETGGASLRFSVRSSVGENLSFVSITDGFIKCHKGECQVRLHSRKSVRKLLSLDEASEACPHLEAMRAQQEVWVDCLPQLEQASGDRMENPNDQGIMAQVISSKQHFNISTGLWDFGGWSKHMPVQKDDKKLQRNRQIRHNINEDNAQHSRDSAGYLTGLSLKPKLPATCSCDIPWTNDQFIVDFNTILFCKH